MPDGRSSTPTSSPTGPRRPSAIRAFARWLDGTYSLAPMTEHLMSAMEWARAGTTLALWMVLPLLIGLWRIQRGEIR